MESRYDWLVLDKTGKVNTTKAEASPRGPHSSNHRTLSKHTLLKCVLIVFLLVDFHILRDLMLIFLNVQDCESRMLFNQATRRATK